MRRDEVLRVRQQKCSYSKGQTVMFQSFVPERPFVSFHFMKVKQLMKYLIVGPSIGF